MDVNQMKDEIKRIEAKKTLKFTLTDREKALLTLYGDLSEKTPTGAIRHERVYGGAR